MARRTDQTPLPLVALAMRTDQTPLVALALRTDQMPPVARSMDRRREVTGRSRDRCVVVVASLVLVRERSIAPLVVVQT
jgi:hypothetical protein